MAYMNPTFNHLRTFYLTTSFIIGFNLLWCSTKVLAFSTMRILCTQIDGLIPFKSSTDQPMASLCFLKIYTTFFSFSVVKFAAIITSLNFSSPRNTNFRCLGNSFRISPFELFSTSYSFTLLLLELSALLYSFRLETTLVNLASAFNSSFFRFSLYSEFSMHSSLSGSFFLIHIIQHLIFKGLRSLLYLLVYSLNSLILPLETRWSIALMIILNCSWTLLHSTSIRHFFMVP